MQSDGLWNGQRCTGGQYLRKKNQGRNDLKKTYDVLVSLKMLHWSEVLKENRLSKSCSVFRNFRCSSVAIGIIRTF